MLAVKTLLLLEPCLQFILLWLFCRRSLENNLPGLASKRYQSQPPKYYSEQKEAMLELDPLQP
jgi:hypothetical protein